MHRGLIENPEPSIIINTYRMLPGHSKNRPWLSEAHSSRGTSDVLFSCYWVSLQPGIWGLRWSNHFPIYYKDDFYAGIISTTAFVRFELQWWSAQYVKGLSNLSHELCLCTLQCYCWEHGQLNVSIISPVSYFYRCTSCFTNQSLYVFTARCFNSLESIYNNQVQQKIWLILIGNQIN